MTSKNSFLVDLKQNAVRRTWSILLFAISFFFVLPVTLMVNFSSLLKYTEEQFLAKQMLVSFKSVVVLNPFIMAATVIFAIIAAIHGFSYLYSRKKTDMYLSVPVSIEKRFAAIFINSMLMYVVPYIIFLIITIIIAGTYGVKDAYIIKMAFVSFGINTLFYLAVYAVTSIAVMLTGNLPVTVLGTGTLLCYENGVKILLLSMFSNYFKTYSPFSDEKFLKTWFSPLGLFLSFQNDFALALKDNISVMPVVEKAALHLVVLAIVYMVITFLLYKARPIEACSKSMAFKKSKKVIKRLIMIPVALVFCLFFESASGNSLGGAIFGLAAGIILCHCVIQAIYEQDLKAAFKDKRSIIYIAVIAGFIFAVFKFDIAGYDKYIPNENKLVSGTISLDTPFGNRASFYDDEYDNVTGDRYRFNNMNIIDKSLLCDIAYTAAQEIDNYSTGYGSEDNPYTISATMKYTLSNGKSVYRNVYFDYKENQELLNRIFADVNFKENYLQLFDSIFAKNESLYEIRYSNDFITETLSNGLNNELISAYKKDFIDMTFSDVENTLASGYLEMYAVIKNDNADENSGMDDSINNYYEFPVFYSFENTKAVLQKQGIDINERVSKEDVFSVTVYDYVNNTEPIEITDADQIEEILDAVYARSQVYFSAVNSHYNNDYDVDISIKPEKYNGYYNIGCGFKNGHVPDFIKQN